MNMEGRRCAFANATIRARCGKKKGLDRTSTICAPPDAAPRNAASKSYGGFSSRSACTCKFSAFAAGSAAPNWSADCASKSRANRVLSGNAWVSSSTCFRASSNCWKTNPVMLPGRARPGINPCQRIEIDGDYDDGNEAARAHDRLQRRFGPGGDDQIRLRAHQLRCDDEGATRVVQPPIVNGEVLTFVKAEVAQLRTERLILGDCRRIIEARTEEAEPNESAGLLRSRRERPRRSAAEQRDEVAPFQWPMSPVLPTGRIAHLGMEETAAVLDFNAAYDRSRSDFGHSAMSAQCPVSD